MPASARCWAGPQGKRPAVLRAGDLVLDLDAHTVRAGDRPVRLTPSEFELLATLMAAPGHAFSRLELLERLQGVAIEGVEHTVNTHNFIASAETFYQRHGSWAGAGEFFRQLERPPEPGAPPRPPQFVLADQNGVVITPAQPYRAGDRVEDDRLARGAPVEVAGRRVGTVIDVARARRIALQVSVEPELPDVVVDPERMIQVLGNLVTNALRYTPPAGRIALSARLQGTAVALAVQDTGAGIAPESLPHIFDRFYRGDPARSQQDDESGLGLAIAKALAEAHGGTIEVQSELGRGATFTVLLPAG